ncbi:MAG TPA: hypothetical protein VHK27_05590 [Gammaproteobacteria bacterium]|nr:hypothetical protein [Gammaproteobacteria bacterium]
MFEVFLFVSGVAVGLIAAALWPKGAKWGAKQAGSIQRRWEEVREDYDEFESKAKIEFEQIEREAQERIAQLKKKYRREYGDRS